MRFLRVLALAAAIAIGALAPRERNAVAARPDTTRVRKNWEQLTATEQGACA